MWTTCLLIGCCEALDQVGQGVVYQVFGEAGEGLNVQHPGLEQLQKECKKGLRLACGVGFTALCTQEKEIGAVNAGVRAGEGLAELRPGELGRP